MHDFMQDGPDQMGQEFMRGGHHHMEHVPFPFFSPLIQLLWLAILIFLAYLFIRWITTRGARWNPFMASTNPDGPPLAQRADVPPTPYSEQPSALEILNRRYANGEIDAATFEHMRERIIGSQPPNQG